MANQFAVVKRAFRCKLTMIHYSVGRTYEADEARIAALVQGGFLLPPVRENGGTGTDTVPTSTTAPPTTEPTTTAPDMMMDNGQTEQLDEPYAIGDSAEDDGFPKHLGAGYYELSNGEKVRGKEKAEEAQVELDKGGAE